MSRYKKVGNKSRILGHLWACLIVYLLLIATIFTISTSVLANNPPDVRIMEPGAGETVSGVMTVWILASDPDGNDQIKEVWVTIDFGDLLNATYNHTNGEGQWWYYVWDTTTVEDGWHHIKAIAFDGIDEAFDTIEVQVVNVPDNNPPGIAIMEPDNNATVSGTVVIWMLAWDPDGHDQIQDVWVRIDWGDWLNATYNHTTGEGQWWYYEWDTTTVDDGWHNISAIVYDGMNYGDALIKVKVDNIPENTPPRIEIVHPKGGATLSGVVTIWMVAWDADGNDQIQDVWVIIDGGDWLNATYNHTNAEGQWWYYEWDTTKVDDGGHSIKAIVYDGIAYGDYRIEVTVDNTPDNTPPRIEIVHPKGGATVSGVVTIWMVAWDADGNDQIQDVWVRIDWGDWLNATYNHTTGEGQWWYYEWDTTKFDDGWHHITAIVFDGMNYGDDLIEVFVDNVPENHPPGIDIVDPKGGSSVSGVVTIWMVAWDPDGNDEIQNVWVRIDGGDLLNATYNHTNGEGQWWYYVWDTTTVDDGWHHIKAITFDGQDDASDIIEVYVKNNAENSPPHVEIMDPANGEVVKGVIEVKLRAWDADGPEDIKAVLVRIDYGAWHEATFIEIEGDYSWWTFEWDTTEVDDGEHHIFAKAWDGKDYSEIDVIYVIVDNSLENHAPGIKIVEPKDGYTVSGTINIVIVAWDPDGHDEIEMVWVKIDGGIWIEATFVEINGEGSWWVYEWNTETVDDGWHHIYAKTTDGKLWADDHIEVYVNNNVDNHPPYIEIMEPDGGDTVSGTITIWMVAWDADGLDDIEQVWVRIDSSPKYEATFSHEDKTGSWWYYEWDTTKVDNGWHKITAIVYDGKDDGSDVIEVYVENDPDNSPPHAEIIEPSNGETLSGVIKIWVKAWDPDGKEDVKKVYVKIDEGDWHEAIFYDYDGNYSLWVLEIDTAKFDDGWHHIYARAWDGALYSEKDVVEVIFDNHPDNHQPHAEITEPENGDVISGVVNIWIRAWDEDGPHDIKAVYIRIDAGSWQEATFVEIEGDYSWWVFEWDTTSVENGWHHVYAKAWDGKLYSEKDVLEVYVENPPENHAPGIEIVQPKGGSTVSGVVTIWMVAWDPDGNDEIENVWVKIDGGDLLNATYNHTNGEGQWWYYEWDTTTVDDGWHHIKAMVYDGMKYGDDLIEVFVDNIKENSPPGIEIVHPKGGSTVSGIITIWMVAWDPDGNDEIQNVWVRIDDGDLNNATYNHTNGEGQWWYFEWDTTLLENGWHKITAVVFDGKDDGHHVIEVFVENVKSESPPYLKIHYPEDMAVIVDEEKIIIHAWDPDGKEQVSSVFVKTDEEYWFEARFIGYEGDYSLWVLDWKTTSFKDGKHKIYAKAWDGRMYSDRDEITVDVDRSKEDPSLVGILLLLLLGAAIGVALALASTEIGTMALTSLLFLPLYTKISKKDVLDHFIRGQIFGYIKVNPGDNYTTIKKNLDLNNGTLTYHLNVLEKEGLIKSWTNGSHKFFYPQGVKIPGNGVKNPSIYDAILKSIQESPGITVSDVAAITGISKQLANYHIRRLAAEGKIELERKSLLKVCYPSASS